MPQGWLDTTDTGLLGFAQNMSTKVMASPSTWNFSTADATTLSTATGTYSTNLSAATDPEARSPVTVAAKDVAKAALIAEIRSLAKRIQANASITPEDKITLGIPVHKTTPTVIPAPVTRPVLAVAGIAKGRSLTIRIADETTPTKNAKPFGVDGAEIYTYVPTGTETPPIDLSKWRFEGIAKRASFELRYDGEDIGKTAYVRALWFNPRGESGPASDDVTATIAA